jgi:hypothetical protein
MLKLEGLSFLEASLIVQSCPVDESPVTLYLCLHLLETVFRELNRRNHIEGFGLSVVTKTTLRCAGSVCLRCCENTVYRAVGWQ